MILRVIPRAAAGRTVRRRLSTRAFAVFSLAISTLPAVALEGTDAELAALKACEKQICTMILTKQPTGADFACGLQKTWAKSTLRSRTVAGAARALSIAAARDTGEPGAGDGGSPRIGLSSPSSSGRLPHGEVGVTRERLSCRAAVRLARRGASGASAPAPAAPARASRASAAARRQQRRGGPFAQALRAAARPALASRRLDPHQRPGRGAARPSIAASRARALGPAGLFPPGASAPRGPRRPRPGGGAAIADRAPAPRSRPPARELAALRLGRARLGRVGRAGDRVPRCPPARRRLGLGRRIRAAPSLSRAAARCGCWARRAALASLSAPSAARRGDRAGGPPRSPRPGRA